MTIKKAKYKKVKVLQNKMISDEVYGCDECRKEIKEFPNESSRLELTVYQKESNGSSNFHFCSWACVLKHIPKIKSDYFVSMPFIYFDESPESPRSAKALVDILKKVVFKSY